MINGGKMQSSLSKHFILLSRDASVKKSLLPQNLDLDRTDKHLIYDHIFLQICNSNLAFLLHFDYFSFFLVAKIYLLSRSKIVFKMK